LIFNTIDIKLNNSIIINLPVTFFLLIINFFVKNDRQCNFLYVTSCCKFGLFLFRLNINVLYELGMSFWFLEIN